MSYKRLYKDDTLNKDGKILSEKIHILFKPLVKELSHFSLIDFEILVNHEISMLCAQERIIRRVKERKRNERRNCS